MIPLRNPYNAAGDALCFGCSDRNDAGLKMEFFLDGTEVVALWEPREHFMGFDHVLHGGIRATLIDEIAAWAIFVLLDTMGYTTRLEVNYNDVVYTNRGTVTLRARIREASRKTALVDVDILNEKGQVATSGTAEYFILPTPIARSKKGFPPREAFFEETPPALPEKPGNSGLLSK